MTAPHTHSIRVYYEDTDLAGVVYYANYLKFAERGRTEALRSLGFEQTDLWDSHNVGFVVRKCLVDFLRPARFNDCLTIETSLVNSGATKLVMRQRILREETELVMLEVTLATVNCEMKPVRMPAMLRNALSTIATKG